MINQGKQFQEDFKRVVHDLLLDGTKHEEFFEDLRRELAKFLDTEGKKNEVLDILIDSQPDFPILGLQLVI